MGTWTHVSNRLYHCVHQRVSILGSGPIFRCSFYDANTNQINSAAYNNRFLFTGRKYAATYRSNYVPKFRFYEYRARAYHPDLGRFMSEEPKLFDAGDYNLFRYCHNDPRGHEEYNRWKRIYRRTQRGGTDDVGMDPYRKGPLGKAEVARMQSYEIGYGDTRWWFPNAFKQISTAAPGGIVKNQLIPLAVDPSDDHP